ncbi:MAG: stage IV sporulation protein A [Clostridia bacterium]|nr:stage IV sporulation protein A [Clostridia bacterium]
MADLSIYEEISRRTEGDIYIGVVGPVRTGKSTLINRFMQTLVLPYMDSPAKKERARDEMPQSASGRTVMTTEPKFVPEEAAVIKLDENVVFRMRMIDCVGYIVPGAIGHVEDGETRMVMTPWSDSPMAFEAAAELGTQKVISEHSTIGILVTTDGSIGEIERSAYIDAESRIVREMKSTGKPFVIVLNSAYPIEKRTLALAKELEESYDVPVIPVNCSEMDERDIKDILTAVLYEFPVREIKFALPAWIDVQQSGKIKNELYKDISDTVNKIKRIGDVKQTFGNFTTENGGKANIEKVDLGDGTTQISVIVPDELFFAALGEHSGFEITDEKSLFSTLAYLKTVNDKYSKVSEALAQVNRTGYGIVTPDVDDLTLDEPEIVRQPGGYGVKLKASAPSIHMIKANIQTELSPTVGTERQSEELVEYLLREFEEDPKKIWGSNMFGKSLYELIGEGINAKLAHMPEDARGKLSETLERIINEGSGGLICILL